MPNALPPRSNPRRRSHASVLDPASPFTVLVQRLNYAARYPERRFVNLADNVPCWPALQAFAGPRPVELQEYAASEGTSALRSALRARELRRWQVEVAPEEILVTNGALHGIALVSRALRRPGSIALCQAPVLSCVGELLRRDQFDVRYFDVAHGAPAWDQLRAELARRPRLVYLNTPNNPTGDVMSPAALGELIALAQAHGASVVVDAAYDDFIFDDTPAVSALAVGADLAQLYVVNSMSKNYGMPGLRVGWVVSSAAHIEALASAMELDCIAVAGAMQRIAAEIVERGNAALIAHVAAGRALVARALARMSGPRVAIPGGGSQLMIELPIDDIEEFGDAVLVEHGLILATSGQFEGAPASIVRIPTGVDHRELETGLAMLRDAIDHF